MRACHERQHRRVNAFLHSIVALMLATTCSILEAQNLTSAEISYDRSPETLLITYHEIFSELAEPDSTPRIRIYGDGRVLIHYSQPLRRAGDYELRLSSTELEELLLSLVDNGLADFDQKAVAGEKRELDAERAQEALTSMPGESPTLFYVADQNISVLELRLTGYRAPGSPFAAGEIHQTISWRGLTTDAERYPEIERIQQLRAAELRLQSLLERDDLWRIR